MSYNPEQLYEDAAKREHRAESAESRAAQIIWDEISTPNENDATKSDGAHDFFRAHEPLEFAEFVIFEIAKIRNEIRGWKHPCSQGTKAACFDKIEAALDVLVKQAAENAPIENNYADAKRELAV
jgi:hypothetical protein